MSLTENPACFGRLPLFAAMAALAFPAVAEAQAYQCRAPGGIAAVGAAQKPADESRRILPVSGYTLALSWSPEFCRLNQKAARHKYQCGGDAGRFAFILHGLWPDAQGSSYPQWCRATRALPPALVKRNFCMMPSTRLMATEWAKHGTCMTRRPETYFRIAKTMFAAVRYPNMDKLSRRPLTAGGLRTAIAAVNDGLGADMIRLKINQRGWLQEVRLCLGKSFRPRRCPASMQQVRDDRTVKIWRGA